jgi:hypothetical protein
VGGPGSSAVLISLDRTVATRELDARAPRDRSARQAAERAAGLKLVGSGAAERISFALKSVKPRPETRA